MKKTIIYFILIISTLFLENNVFGQSCSGSGAIEYTGQNNIAPGTTLYVNQGGEWRIYRSNWSTSALLTDPDSRCDPEYWNWPACQNGSEKYYEYVSTCTLCSVDAASGSPTSCVGTAITSITHATTGVTGVTSSTNLPAGVSASYDNNVLTISGTPTESGTFNYTIDVVGCATNATGTITVNALPTANAGAATTSICQGATSAALGGSVGGGATGGTWTENGTGSINNPTDLANATYTAGAGETGSITLTLTTSGGSCGTTTASKTITVNANPTADVGAATTPICQGATSTALGGSVGGGATGGTWTENGTGSINNPTDLANATYTAGAGETGSITLTLTTNGGSCGTTTATKTITVNANPTATAGGALADICQSGTSAAMGGSVGGGATGGTWSGGAGTWTNANDPSTATYTASAGESGSITLTLTTSGGSCGTTTATKNITVNASATANAGGALTAICQGATSAAMGGSVGAGATGGTWSGGAGTWTNANDPSTATYTASAGESGSITLTLTTSGSTCGTTATKSITVNATTVGGTISSDATVCTGSNSATLNLSGHTGSVTKWQYSTDNWTTPVDITNTGTTQAYLNLTTSTKYRAVVQSGVCSAANSAEVSITITANRTVGAASTATQTVCYNTAITSVTHATTGVTGITSSAGLPTGVSASYAANVITISGTPTQGGTFNYTITPTSTCGSATATGQIIVHDDLSAGVIASDQIIALNTVPSAFTSSTAASGGGGFTYQWQSSVDNSTWGNIATETSATYAPAAAISQDTWYRRAAISSSGCGTQYTASVRVSVRVSVCSGGTPTAISELTVASGGVGGFTYQWQSSTDGSTFADINLATSETYNPTSISNSTWYRRCVTSGTCTECTQAVKATVASSPGAISTGLLVWLKADAGTSNLSSQWEDQSGNGYHYTTVNGPSLSAGDSSSNYNPYITITSGGFNAPASAALGNNYTIFMVAKKLKADYSGRIFDGHTGNHYWGYTGQTANDTIKKLQVITSSAGTENGVRVDINQGANFSSESCHSAVYELIIYNSVLSTSEINIIESYLNTKYRLKNNNNFLTSLGSPTYNPTGAYTRDIIGIGKECYFHQKQAKSQDDSTLVYLKSTLAATNAANAGTVSNDISYLMVGHNGGKLKGTAASKADVPPAGSLDFSGAPVTISSRIEREWKIKNTNFSNQITFKTKIDMHNDSIKDVAHLALLVDDDGDFTSGCTVYKHGDNGIVFRKGSIEIDGIEGVVGAGLEKFIAIGAIDPETELPVELTQFKARSEQDYNLITWTTESEINNSHFVIEKSDDGINWETVTIVSGAGNSTTKNNYSYADYDQCLGKCYYRLQQVDFSGEYSYSPIEFIDNSKTKNSNLKVYPIPVKDKAVVEFTVSNTGVYELEIFTASGARLFISKVICAEGENVFDINTNIYARGLYYMVIKNVEGEVMNRITFTK